MKRALWMGIVVSMVTAELAVGAAYIWDGGGAANDWSDPLNWAADSGFPSGSGDDATIPDGFALSLTNVPGDLHFLLHPGPDDFFYTSHHFSLAFSLPLG